MSKPVLILAAVAIIVTAWLHRYEAHPGSVAGLPFVLDRWTGSVRWLDHERASPRDVSPPVDLLATDR